MRVGVLPIRERVEKVFFSKRNIIATRMFSVPLELLKQYFWILVKMGLKLVHNFIIPGIAKNSATTTVLVHNFLIPGIAKNSATTEIFGDGKARPTIFEMYSTTTESKVAGSSGGARPSRPRVKSTAAAKLVGEVRPGIAKQSATTEADIAGFLDEAQPLGIEKKGATMDSDIAVSSGEAGLWPKANGKNSAAATAAVKSAGKARPPGIARQSATTEHEFAQSSDEVGPSWSKAKGMNSRRFSSSQVCW